MILQANRIFFTVPGRDAPIIHETTICIEKGDFVVILGHNGSGKSSLVKILSGSRVPSTGQVTLEGIALQKIDESAKAQNIITLTQKPDERLFQDLTLEENIALWESRFEKQNRVDIKEVLELTGIGHRLASKTDQLIRDFSGGEKQSILLGLALSHPPKVLLLDEHTASLDHKASREVMERTSGAIEEHGITAVMVTHHLEDAINYGSRLIIMNEGRVVVDEPKSADLNKKKLQEMMG